MVGQYISAPAWGLAGYGLRDMLYAFPDSRGDPGVSFDALNIYIWSTPKAQRRTLVITLTMSKMNEPLYKGCGRSQVPCVGLRELLAGIEAQPWH